MLNHEFGFAIRSRHRPQPAPCPTLCGLMIAAGCVLFDHDGVGFGLIEILALVIDSPEKSMVRPSSVGMIAKDDTGMLVLFVLAQRVTSI
ncbi:hypothetical protein M2171_001679 [Bradyrhizobium japonicum USDA 38]|nr:hypothetical protein [Bradyrhizobium japonicum]MCS3892546.1 hypothetical protein [Bradyrhizobium japonicum USDA 38]MCS3945060.1 hypothetical protein [Bradyrhizobium japonicum]